MSRSPKSMVNTEELGRAIRRRRVELDLSLRDVADATSVSASTLSRIENGTGKPDADKLTLPLNPLRGATVIVLEPLDPWTTVRLPGDAERLKSGAAAAGVKVAVDRYAPLPLVEPPGLPVAYPIR